MSENIIQKSFVTNVTKVTQITISSKNAIKIKHLSMEKFKILTKLNPKTVGGGGGVGGFNLTPLCCFSKSASSKEREKFH